MTQQRKFKARVESTKVSEKFVSKNARLKGVTGRDNVIKKWVGLKTDKVPEDDVYIMKYFKRPEFSLADALKMHRELAQPAMFDNMEGIVYLDSQMNFKTKKKTKFQANIKTFLNLPHNFEDGRENNIVALCESKEEADAALEAGAKYAGGLELISQIDSGEVNSVEHWNLLVATEEILPEVAKIRKKLKDHFPYQKTGHLCQDIVEAVKFFKDCFTLKSIKLDDETGFMRLPVGRLNMSDEQLQDNLKTLVDSLCLKQKDAVGPFFTSAFLVVPPSSERFLLTRPHLTGALKKERKMKGKKKKTVKEEVVDDDDDDDDEQEETAMA